MDIDLALPHDRDHHAGPALSAHDAGGLGSGGPPGRRDHNLRRHMTNVSATGDAPHYCQHHRAGWLVTCTATATPRSTYTTCTGSIAAGAVPSKPYAGSTSGLNPAPSTPCWESTAPARPPCSKSSKGSPPRPPARACARARPDHRPLGSTPPVRGPAPAQRVLRRPHGARDPHDVGRHGDRSPPCRRGARPARPGRTRRGTHASPVRRRAAACRPGLHPDRPPGGADARRADHRPRPGEPAPRLGPDPVAARGRGCGPRHDALPRGGRGARRPDLDHACRPHRPGGHP